MTSQAGSPGRALRRAQGLCWQVLGRRLGRLPSVPRPVTGLGEQLAASGHLLDEQTLSVGLEVPSQQMDLDRRIQMRGLGLVQTTDTSGRSR